MLTRERHPRQHRILLQRPTALGWLSQSGLHLLSQSVTPSGFVPEGWLGSGGSRDALMGFCPPGRAIGSVLRKKHQAVGNVDEKLKKVVEDFIIYFLLDLSLKESLSEPGRTVFAQVLLPRLLPEGCTW